VKRDIVPPSKEKNACHCDSKIVQKRVVILNLTCVYVHVGTQESISTKYS
jgi:hypothetical protein